MLETTHQCQGIRAMLLFKKLHLVQSYAMFSGASAIGGDRPSNQIMVNALGLLPLLGIVRVQQHQDVEITIAHVARNGVWEAGVLQFIDRLTYGRSPPAHWRHPASENCRWPPTRLLAADIAAPSLR
jgi:hypothetical protein